MSKSKNTIQFPNASVWFEVTYNTTLFINNRNNPISEAARPGLAASHF